MANDPVVTTEARALAICRDCHQPVEGLLTMRTGIFMGGNTIIVGIHQNNEIHDIAEVKLREIPMGDQ